MSSQLLKLINRIYQESGPGDPEELVALYVYYLKVQRLLTDEEVIHCLTERLSLPGTTTLESNAYSNFIEEMQSL